MLPLVSALVALLATAAAELCGGVLTEPRGLIQTPGFPAPLSVPIRCRWLVDSSGMSEPDIQIIVYLTQMFVTSGLTFTEYSYYDAMDSKLQKLPSLLLRVTEENSVRTRWLRTLSRFLVIELVLERLEGNHLRVLDHLLDVFGFNITYEMVTGPVRNDSCSVIDCSFAGNCFASPDYSEFWCSCFEEFSGPSCSFGPACQPGSDPCLNGGVCRQVGKYATCTCLQQYSGSRCEVPLFNGCTGDSGCQVQCRARDNQDSPCGCGDDCKVEGGRWRYIFTMKLANFSSLTLQHPGSSLNRYLECQIMWFFRKLSMTRFEDMQILKVSDNGLVSFHFFSNMKDMIKVQAGQQKIYATERLGELALLPPITYLDYEEGLRIEVFHMGHEDDVFESEQVIFSCIAKGSERIEFSWYKDGYSIDPNKSLGGLWMHLLPKNSQDEYTAILGIDAVKTIDQGRYTCHAADWGIQECKSVDLEVWGPPMTQISPMAASLNKGDNIDLTCVSTNQGVSYSWTRDKNLFALNPGKEVWEDLQPWGSILRVYNVQESITYTCSAQTKAAMGERTVNIDLLTPGFCEEIEEAELLWRSTASGSLAMAECPLRYTGHATRYCLKGGPGEEAHWGQPDFSDCVYDSLNQIMIDFQMISRGYQKSTLWFLLSELFSWFNSQMSYHRGEGESIVDFLSEVAAYVNHTFTSEEVLNVTEVFFANVDLLLSQPNSFIHIEKVSKLQKLVDQWSIMWSEHINLKVAHLSYSELVVDVIKLKNGVQHQYNVPMHYNYPFWYTANIRIDAMTTLQNQMNRVTVVNYQNITKFFPTKFFPILRDGSELTYEIQSSIVSISAGDDVKLRLEMTLPVRGQVSDSWNLTCARMDLVGLGWDFTSCSQVSQTGNSSHCICHKPGVYAALVTKRSFAEMLHTTRNRTSPLVVIGCVSCLVQSCFTLVLLSGCRSFLQLLKVQFCLAVSAIMAIFVYVTRISPSEDLSQFLSIILELLFFIALSSHLGKLLIIYKEFVVIPNFKIAKGTVVALISGITVLPCLISVTAESFSTTKSKSSWWLPIGSASFYTAAFSAFLIVCLFLIMFFNLLKRLHILKTIRSAKMNQIKLRLGLIKRTSVLFTTTVILAISSVLFVNIPNMVNICIFSSLSALLGFLIFLCYILHSESPLNRKQFNITAQDHYCHSDSDSNSHNYFTKPRAQAKNASLPSIALKEIPETTTPKPKAVIFNEEPEYENVGSMDLEIYINSPKKYCKAVVGGKVSVVNNPIIIPRIEITDVMESNEETERLSQVFSPTIVEDYFLEESLLVRCASDMLISISHDLDYLLNRQHSCGVAKESSVAFSKHKSCGDLSFCQPEVTRDE